MKNREIASRKQYLDELFKRVAAFSGDVEMQSHWARYLCVLVSGFIEDSVRTIFMEYARAKATPNIVNYVSDQLRYFTNANTEKILALAAQFSKDWEQRLRMAIDIELKDAIDSTVARRHEIAHGKSSGITCHSIREYYGRIIEAIELIEHHCGV